MEEKNFMKKSQSRGDSGFARVLTILVLLCLTVTSAWATPNSIVINGTPQVGDKSISLTYHFDPDNVTNYNYGYLPTLKVKCAADNKWDEVNLPNEASSDTKTISLSTLGEFEAGKTYEVCFAYNNGGWVDDVFQSFVPAPAGYTVSLKDGTEDADKWTITPAEATTTGVAEGTKITATYTGTKRVKSVKAVKKYAVIPVTSVKLDKAVLRIYKYASSLLLTATVSPDDATDKTVTWTSSDTNVATVNASGKVIPKKAGTTTITATANDGSGMKAASTVYVYDKIVDTNTETANVTVYAGESWLIKGNATTPWTNSINIGDGASATLLDVYITQPITCSATATIILADGSTNTVDASGINDKAAIQIGGTGKTLTINAETAGDGKLTVQGGSDAAGIGTNKEETGGNIVINGGRVTATGGAHAAGIGTGNAENNTNECGSITINGGTVTAKGGSYGVGIGTGCAYNLSNTCGAITINGGTVTATGGQLGAGIGTGWANNETNTCGAITIDTGVTSVTATKGGGIGIFNSIGTGMNSSGTQKCGTITFGTAAVFNGSAWSSDPMAAGTYGGLNLAISGSTWTLTPSN